MNKNYNLAVPNGVTLEKQPKVQDGNSSYTTYAPANVQNALWS